MINFIQTENRRVNMSYKEELREMQDQELLDCYRSAYYTDAFIEEMVIRLFKEKIKSNDPRIHTRINE